MASTRLRRHDQPRVQESTTGQPRHSRHMERTGQARAAVLRPTGPAGDSMRIRFVPTARNLFVVGILALSVPSGGYAQDSSAAPPPIGRLVDIGGRRLHINCTGSGAPSVVVENGSSRLFIEMAILQ